ncbi:hypothetical protein SGV89_03395 [Klebsiella pneumoniae]|nr:hypothetical protein [Klebsiella pneumoniae]MDX4489376.1 hypothetical protein [Klebsiella pneumoniae]MDX4496736.1 hypothetical protein [Klebsiella pneumoniae]
MTDITELAQREKFEAWLSEKPLHARYVHWCGSLKAYDYTGIQLAWEAYQAGGAELVEALEKARQVDEELCKLLPPGAEYMDPPDGGDVTPLEGVRRMVADYRQRIAELESRTVKPAPVIPSELHPDTQKLVTDFCTALAEKLYKAQLKYGYDADWKQDGWPSQCQAHFHQHIAKGDPRDVAAYCAFMWWHGWSTKPAECLEPRTVTVKLPDYRNTYKSPLADEVEHQVRLALELLSSAAGIKVEDE